MFKRNWNFYVPTGFALVGLFFCSGLAIGKQQSKALENEQKKQMRNEKTDDWNDRLQKRIDKSKLDQKELSILVEKHEEGKNAQTFSLHADKGFIPASLTKIITAAMSLEKYPVGQKFITELCALAPVEDNRLKGDLFLKGGGDPGFVSESMWILVNEFMRTGIRIIEGDLIVDDTRFDEERFDPGRDPERVDRAYDAPIGAMSFNWNSANIYIRPGDKEGQVARVYVDPENSYIQLVNKTITGKSSTKKNLQVERKSNGTSHDTIVVSGQIPLGSEEAVIYKSVLHPDLWSAFNLRSFLERRGLSVKGQIRRGQVPSGAKLLAKVESKPIGSLVNDMMKFSNNYVAEMLTKNLAAEIVGTPGTMSKGLNLLGDYLVEKGFQSDAFSLTSPSGLSRRNRLTARQLLHVLEDIRKNFTIFPEFVSSLPILGVDGTLRSRLKKSLAQGWVRAKTGMLTGVAGLAGYAGRQDGGMITFVFLYNGKGSHVLDAKKLFDQLIEEIVL